TAAHGAGVTLCVVGRSIVGCDIEIVSARPDATWRGLLGPHAELARLVSVLTNEPADNSATRVWAAVESLRKAGRPIGAPLVVHSADPGQATSAVGDRPGWVVFSSGRQRIITFVT